MLPLAIAFVVILLDQLTKLAVRGDFALFSDHPIIPGLFSLTYVRNTGAAWGMMDKHTSALALLSLVVLILVVIFRKHFLKETLMDRIILGLMVGGIAGNMIDRIKLGYVTDFLDFYVAGHHWPSFNVADSAICVAVGLYILNSYLEQRREKRAAIANEGK